MNLKNRAFGLAMSCALLGALALLSHPPASSQDQAHGVGPAYLDPSLPLEKRVHDLVSRMTLEEKVLQMQHTAPAIPRLGVPAYDW